MEINLLFFLTVIPAIILYGIAKSALGGSMTLISVPLMTIVMPLNQALGIILPILIFSVPLFDMMLVVFSRLKRQKHIHKASRDHTYHRLAQRGIPIHHSVLIMHGTSLMLSMVGFLCLNLPVLHANIIFGLIVLLGLGAFTILDQNYQ